MFALKYIVWPWYAQSVKLDSGLDRHKVPVWPQPPMASSAGSLGASWQLWAPYQSSLSNSTSGKDRLFHPCAAQSRSHYVQVALGHVKRG